MARRLLPLVLVSLLASVTGAQSPSGLAAREVYLAKALDSWAMDRGIAIAMRLDQLPQARIEAAEVLATNPDPQDLPLLSAYLNDADPRVRQRVMLAAGRLGEGGRQLALAGLEDASPLVRQAAAWAACHVGSAAWGPVSRLLTVENDPGVLETTLANLWRLEDAPWPAAAGRFADHDSPLLRRAAAYSLSRSGEPAARPGQRLLAADDEPVIRATAVRGFARGSLEPADVAGLAAALVDADWRVQAAACSALAAQPPLELPTAAAAAVDAAMAAAQPHLAAAALTAAAAQPAAGSTDRLLTVARGSDRWLAGLALTALAARDHEAAPALAAAWAMSDDMGRRRAAARAAVRLGPEAEARAAGDEDPGVRLAWLETLDEEAVEPRRERLLQLLLNDRDPAVRAQVLGLLRRAELAPSADELLGFATQWQDDTMADARAEALVTAYLSAESPARNAARRMALADRDSAVAALFANGVRAAGEWVSLPPREPRHGEQWYRELVDWKAETRWLDVVTERGTFRIWLDLDTAPLTAREIWDLAAAGFYDGLGFHRVVPNFVVQGGDPRGDGWGGPGFVLPDEPSLVPFDSWRVGIATSGPQTGGCQLFVTLLPADRLTGHYTNFGEVVAGRQVLTELRVGDRILEVRSLTGDSVPPVTPEAQPAKPPAKPSPASGG